MPSKKKDMPYSWEMVVEANRHGTVEDLDLALPLEAHSPLRSTAKFTPIKRQEDIGIGVFVQREPES
jgi:hypothetical protein